MSTRQILSIVPTLSNAPPINETAKSTEMDRTAGLSHTRLEVPHRQQYVYPSNVWETIRTGPRMFPTVHGVDGSKRYESKNGKAPPKKAGSALGGKWVLTAKPPSVKGDRELLPWE